MKILLANFEDKTFHLSYNYTYTQSTKLMDIHYSKGFVVVNYIPEPEEVWFIAIKPEAIHTCMHVICIKQVQFVKR